MTIASELEWLASRQTGVGSSDSPVLALEPDKVFGHTPLDIYISKKAEITDNEEDNPNFRRGHTYEPLAIALAEAKLGMRIHAPQNDMERWNDYQVRDPGRSYLYADFDGVREDGWVVEVKSPMQRVADKIRTEGLKDYYQVQGQHLVHVGDVGGLPVLGKLPDGCPGVCFVIYECEKVAVQIYEMPRNQDMIDAILANADNFWNNHVALDNPPIDYIQQPVQTRKTKTKYTEVEGEAWVEAVQQYSLAHEAQAAAKNRLEAAKSRIKTAMEQADLSYALIGEHKFQYVQRAGRKTFNEKLLKAEHPTIDLERYKIAGKPYADFRHYGPKEQNKWGDETLDGQLLTIRDELEGFTRRSVDPDVAVEVFDEMRARAELYARMLSLELEGIEAGINSAASALVEKVKGGSNV